MNVTRYLPENGAFVGHDLPGICNRALFCANTPTTLLAGDRPVLRLIRYGTLLGTLHLWADTPAGPLPLEKAASTRFAYRSNLAEWQLRDPALPGSVTLTACVPEDTEGFVLHITAELPVTLRWSYGGIHTFEECHWNLTPDDPEAIACAETPAEWYTGNRVQSTENGCILSADGSMEGAFATGLQVQDGQVRRTVCGESVVYLRSDSCTAEQDRVTGTLEACGKPVYIAVGRAPLAEPADLYTSALRRHEQLAGIFESHTPDAYLDTQMAALAPQIDGAWYGQYTVHSNQAWNAPYLGWCNRFGNALGGWFDRVLTEVEYYCGHINKTEDRRGSAGSPDLRYTEPDSNSRFYGIGHVDQHQYMYNMQSQFFDQAIFAWRMTGDARLAELLRDALEYHTLWQDECFDADNDGLYESIINTWPTDSVWYNGGGSCEETCYAYRAHQAAKELALAAGDAACAEKHAQRLALIRRGFFEKLWLKDAGYPAMYIEDGGHGRAHRSAWQYNSFMPVDMDLADPFEAAMCLDYPRWALEKVQEPTGGSMYWMSNWVPAIWSVRRKSVGENLQQAYAYFKAGFAREGWELLTGVVRGGYCRPLDPLAPAPATPSAIASEAASLLARAVICGLHGYQPDYPNGKVELCPQFPAEWENAALKTSYFTASFRRTASQLHYAFTLPRAADVTVRLPLYAVGITGVTGAADWKIVPGFGYQILELTLKNTAAGEIAVGLGDPMPFIEPIDICCAPGAVITPETDPVLTVRDPQELLEVQTLHGGKVTLTLRNDMDGAHMLFLKCAQGDAVYWQRLRLAVSPTAAKLEQQARTAPELTGRCFEPLTLTDTLCNDVSTIYKQNYYTQRDHIHLSIGADGFSPWTFAHWQLPCPDIRLETTGQTVFSSQGVPFVIGSATRNIAFTSLYDNWPTAVTVPVNRAAYAAEVLVCGSTNPMQIAIANAVLHFTYTDGTEDTLELVNPDNYWQLAPYSGRPTEKEQDTVNDYSYETDAFCLPEVPPTLLQLGQNCRAVALGWRLQTGKTLASVTLETLSQEIVVGLMGITLVDPVK